MCFMASAMELMWPGVPVTACATIHPRRSKTPAERSPASRTMEVKEVRIKAAACSFTTPMRRFQQMSRVMGSNLVLASPLSSPATPRQRFGSKVILVLASPLSSPAAPRQRFGSKVILVLTSPLSSLRALDSALGSRRPRSPRAAGSVAARKSPGGLPWLEDQGQAAIYADARAGTRHRGRLTLLDDGGTCEGLARVESVAVVHGRVHIAARLGEVRLAPSLRCRRGRRGGNRARRGSRDGNVGHGAGDDHAEVERLDGDAEGDTAVKRAIGRLVALDDDAEAGRGEMPPGQLDLDLVSLPRIVHLRGASDAHVSVRDGGVL